ncbi:Rok-like winged helix domain-containing protein [Halalkalibacterium ligniniphilum]|uniref:Rok-like winged helix domain-containing protein n=1 Tax=Halalkalibacterium ligniniphilum TaxID=1134413 RepID=UPI000366E1BD|nr:hypothetical protein [Halalkalibacterium ligniniphilum]
MFTERDAIKQRLHDINEEKTKLSKESLFLLNRLRELDNLERNEKLPITDEEKRTLEPISTPTSEFRSLPEQQEKTPILSKLTYSFEPRRQPQAYKQTERDIEEVLENIKTLLIQKGEPVSRKEIKEMLREKGLLNWASVDYMMKKVMKLDPSIKKIHRGFFEYASSDV